MGIGSQDLPIDTSPAGTATEPGFIGRAALALDVASGTGHPSVAYALVRRAFVMVPDVSITRASLDGFCLGALYTAPTCPVPAPVPIRSR